MTRPRKLKRKPPTVIVVELLEKNAHWENFSEELTCLEKLFEVQGRHYQAHGAVVFHQSRYQNKEEIKNKVGEILWDVKYELRKL